MSWHFSQELEAEFLEENSWDGELSARLKSIPFAPDDSASGRMKDTWHRSPFGMMFVPSTESLGADVLTWFLAGFHARTFQQPEKEPELPEHVPDSGKSSRELSVKYDRAMHSWKTHQCLWEEVLESSLLTLPRWGSMRDGVLSEQSMPALPTAETESGSLLPTPLASIATHGGPNQRDSSGRPGLQMAAAMWPTPSANKTTASGELTNSDGTPWDGKQKPHSATTGKPVQTALMDKVKMFPTPTSSEHKYRLNGDSQQSKSLGAMMRREALNFPTPTSSMMTEADMEQARFCGNDPRRPTYQVAKHAQPAEITDGASSLPLLGIHAKSGNQYPTPKTNGFCGGSGAAAKIRENEDLSAEEKRSMLAGNGGQLNPDWVEWLMGWPIGWTDSKPLETDRFRQWLDSHGWC